MLIVGVQVLYQRTDVRDVDLLAVQASALCEDVCEDERRWDWEEYC